MHIVYEDDYVTLYNGDAFEFIELHKSQRYNLVLADPPYGINFQSNRRTVKYNYIIGDDTKIAYDFVKIVPRLITKDGAAIIFYSQKRPLYSEYARDVLIWVKNNWGSGDLEGSFGNMYEPMLFIPGPKWKVPGKRYPNVFFARKTMNEHHPTEKPIELLEKLILATTRKGDIVFDPFAGSGSTLIAAKNLERKAIGIEIDKTHVATAQKRLKEHDKIARGLLYG